MNAVFVPKSDPLIRYTVSNDRGEKMEDSLGILRSDVRHIQSDVTDIKAEVRAVNVRLDKFQDKLDGVRTDLTAKIDELLSLGRNTRGFSPWGML